MVAERSRLAELEAAKSAITEMVVAHVAARRLSSEPDDLLGAIRAVTATPAFASPEALDAAVDSMIARVAAHLEAAGDAQS